MLNKRSDYGAGLSGEVIVDQEGPVPCPKDAWHAAKAALAGARGFKPPCLDCAPNLVLKDYVEGDGSWAWGLLVAHDETCPALAGLTSGTGDGAVGD